MQRSFHAALCVVGIVSPASAQSRLARPTIDTVNHHIVRVMNSGPTAWTDTNGWKLVLERTVQPPEGSPGMLERPSGLILLGDGRVIVSQRNPASVRVYDRQGRLANSIGREGEGPGEFRAPKLAMFHDTVVVHDGRLGRAVLVRIDGTFIRQFVTNVHNDGAPVVVDDRGRLRLPTVRASTTDMLSQWVYFDLNGKRLDSVLVPEAVKVKTWSARENGGTVSYIVPFASQNNYATLRNGSILFGGGDRYQFLLTNSGRDTVRIFGRLGVPADPVPAAIRDSVFQLYSTNPQLRAMGISESDLPRTYPLWGGVALDGTGHAWVEVGQPASKGYHFDVFNPTGVYLGAVAAPFEGLWRASWAGDHVAVLDTDENDLPRIRIFRIDRRGH